MMPPNPKEKPNCFGLVQKEDFLGSETTVCASN